MSKLKGLLLTQGMHGMISQVEGLAKALDIDFTHHKVELKNIWKLVPPKFTPISQNVYKKVNDIDFDLIISCGRKSVIPSIHLKSISKGEITAIAKPINLGKTIQLWEIKITDQEGQLISISKLTTYTRIKKK